MNPGTSEMYFVHELDAVPQMRGVLALFEGVATGAADGYARVTGRPAAVLLHLGPGLGNGLANLHNARRAHTPVVAIVGAHATYHEHYDAPLQSDIAGVARNVSGWYRASAFARDVGRDAAAAVAAALRPPGQVVTLVLPADVSWGEGAAPARPRALPPAQPVDDEAVGQAAAVLASGEPALLLLGGAGTGEPGLRAASRICAATGARMLGEVFPARQARGAGVPPLERLAYLAESAQNQLQGVRHLVLAGARSPVSFFAYPGRPSDLVPDGASVHTLADRLVVDRLGRRQRAGRRGSRTLAPRHIGGQYQRRHLARRLQGGRHRRRGVTAHVPGERRGAIPARDVPRQALDVRL